MLPVLIRIDQVSLRSYWQRWCWRPVRPLLVFAAIGIGLGSLAIGVVAHHRVSETVFSRAIAVLLAFTGAKLIRDGTTGLIDKNIRWAI